MRDALFSPEDEGKLSSVDICTRKNDAMLALAVFVVVLLFLRLKIP